MSTDDLVLALLKAGRLKVDEQTGRAWVYLTQQHRWVEKKLTRKAGSGRARYHFNLLGRKTTVYLSRLVYLVTTGDRAEVVDHRNGDRHNDRPENLGPHTRAESDRQGYDVQVRQRIKEVGDWFDFMAELEGVG